jgi:chlorobactene glucosyltransferase
MLEIEPRPPNADDPAVQFLYQFLVLVILLAILANVLINLLHFDGLHPVAPPDDGPLVSVLVPARNEALNIEACLRSLLLQDYPRYELIVLDDHSTDRTAEIIQKLIAEVRNPRMSARFLRGQPLPDGWVGKNWACHQLSEAASGEFLFFTDADTIHAPGTVTAAVDYACRNNASLVSAWPQMITDTLGEKLIVPMILMMGLAFCPMWLQRFWQRRPQHIQQAYTKQIAAANGQFMFFTRQAYDHIGGHAAVRSKLVEDVSLGREVSARMSEGLRLFNCDSLKFSTVRMYRSFAETWEGFTKNMRAVFDDQAALFWIYGLVQTACFLLPFLFIFLAPPLVWKLVVIQISIIYLIRFLLAWRFRTSLLGALLHPIGTVLMMLIGLNSWRRTIGAGVVWKGRTYRPQM